MEKIISNKIGDSLEAGNLKFITMLPEDTLFIFNYYLMLRHLGQLKKFELVMGKKKSSFIYRALYCGPCRETNRFAIRQSNTQIDLRTFAT